MPEPLATASRDAAMSLIRAALAAADPWTLVREKLALTADAVRIANLALDRNSLENIYVIGAGKAGAPMAAAVEDALGELITDGLVIVKDGYRTMETSRIEVIEAAHPVPDERGAAGARRILEMVARAGSHDAVICLISGGGSALLTLPAGNLSLDDIRSTTTSLLRSGAPIDEVNAVRKHLTLASGGRVAMAAGAALVITLIVSDVIGDDLSVIASGPTYPDETSYDNALTVIELRGLIDEVPASVLVHLEAGAAGKLGDTHEPDRGRIFEHGNFYILGSNRTALGAAAASAGLQGFEVYKMTEPLTGEARDAAAELLEFSREQAPGVQPRCFLAGGETTVTVAGEGSGGRAQEFALAAALEIDGAPGTLVFAFGTDGTDGETDAAGAFADGTTVMRARARGLDPEDHLRRNDSHEFFKVLGDLIVTGPTGTNVNDLYGVIIHP